MRIRTTHFVDDYPCPSPPKVLLANTAADPCRVTKSAIEKRGEFIPTTNSSYDFKCWMLKTRCAPASIGPARCIRRRCISYVPHAAEPARPPTRGQIPRRTGVLGCRGGCISTEARPLGVAAQKLPPGRAGRPAPPRAGHQYSCHRARQIGRAGGAVLWPLVLPPAL